MNINDMTIGQAKELAAMFGAGQQKAEGLNCMIGKKVIIRTYSAGCWFGELSQKSGNEVIVINARRLYRYQCLESISLSSVALHGLCHDKSMVCEPLPQQWLEAIEITPCTDKAIESLEGAPIVQAK